MRYISYLRRTNEEHDVSIFSLLSRQFTARKFSDMRKKAKVIENLPIPNEIFLQMVQNAKDEKTRSMQKMVYFPAYFFNFIYLF